MKKISLCIVMVLVFSAMLLAQESEPSEIVGYVAYPCEVAETGSNNFISLPLYMVDADGDTLRTLNDLGNYSRPAPGESPLIGGVSFWVPETQSWNGVAWNEERQTWEGNPAEGPYELIYGSPYMIAVTEELTFYSVGGLTEPIYYNMIEGDTGNNNFIMIPLDRADLTTLNSVADDIGTVNAVSFWKASAQSWDGIGWNEERQRWDGNPEEGPFESYIAMPLMVSITEPTEWPEGGRRAEPRSRRHNVERRMR